MKKLIISSIVVATLTVGLAGSAYATGNHDNNNHDWPKHHQCKPVEENVTLTNYKYDEQSNDNKEHKDYKDHHKKKWWCKKDKPCQYNPQLKAKDKDCVPPQPEPTPTPEPEPEPQPQPVPIPPVETTSNTVVKTPVAQVEADTEIQGK